MIIEFTFVLCLAVAMGGAPRDVNYIYRALDFGIGRIARHSS
jgi:hypothetical protein